MFYLERLSAPRATPNLIVVGGRLPFYTTASGLVLAAYSTSRVRELLLEVPAEPFRRVRAPSTAELSETLNGILAQGYHITRGYLHSSATSIAVPVLGPHGAAVAAVSAVVPSQDTREAQVLEVIQPAARSISGALMRRYTNDVWGGDEGPAGSTPPAG